MVQASQEFSNSMNCNDFCIIKKLFKTSFEKYLCDMMKVKTRLYTVEMDRAKHNVVAYWKQNETDA